MLTSAVQIDAATFQCPSGDVACLTNAILAANANGEVNVINLEAGIYTIREPSLIDSLGPGWDVTGLPRVTSALTIQGPLATQTVIERDANASMLFRILKVGDTGDLTLRQVTIQGGPDSTSSGQGGGGVKSTGRLTIIDGILKQNRSSVGGGVYSTGLLRMHRSTVTDNSGDGAGGLALVGEALITESAVIYNARLGVVGS